MSKFNSLKNIKKYLNNFVLANFVLRNKYDLKCKILFVYDENAVDISKLVENAQ